MLSELFQPGSTELNTLAIKSFLIKDDLMFKGFNLSLDQYSAPLFATSTIYKSQLEADREKIQESLKQFILVDGSIDGKKLKEAWFPDIKDAHVFISHSHKDLALAESLAGWLFEKFQIHSFIDSHVWGYANDLLRMLDNTYALLPSGNSYSYDIRNETTSHIHMMLSSALHEVMDNTECLLFLNTDNAINNIALAGEVDDHRTASPWIMSELTTSKIIRKKQNVARFYKVQKSYEDLQIRESVSNENYTNLLVRHSAAIDHLIDLKSSDLWEWESNALCYEKYDALTHLYILFADEKFSTDSLSKPL